MNVIFLMLLSLSSLSSVELGLVLPVERINQGELINGKLILRPNEVKNFIPPGLKNKKIGKTLYIQSITPFVGKEGHENYEAEATILFLNVPKGQSATENIEGEQVTIVWKDLEVVPVNATTFELADYFVLGRKKIVPWFIVSAVLIILLFLSVPIYKKSRAKRALKEEKQRLKQRLVSCQTYDDVVELWKDKHVMMKQEPLLMGPFTELEKTLFKHQFRPSRSIEEMDEVMKAYQVFRNSVEGGDLGV